MDYVRWQQMLHFIQHLSAKVALPTPKLQKIQHFEPKKAYERINEANCCKKYNIFSRPHHLMSILL